MPDDSEGKPASVDEKDTRWPLTKDDLYGTSKTDDVPLVYEETPIINPLPDDSVGGQTDKPGAKSVEPEVLSEPKPDPVVSPFTPKSIERTTTSLPKRKPNIFGFLVQAVIVVLLFGAGVGTSIFLRNAFSNVESPSESGPEDVPAVPTLGPIEVSPPDVLPSALPTELPTATSPPRPSTDSSWVSQSVVVGSGRASVRGLTYKLPSTVQSPTCDSSVCASMGTNLPGGTRLTVAMRGGNYLLPDYRGKILADASGKTFDVRDITVAGFKAVEYTGNFSGTTGGGFGFTRIRGVMIELTETVSIEFNHFSPSNRQTDFTSDDRLFNDILNSLTYEM